MITPLQIISDSWTIDITDQGIRYQSNPNKFDNEQTNRVCHFQGCTGTVRINSKSGLCNTHKIHSKDLLLTLINPQGTVINLPFHKEIVDALMTWALTRNFSLHDFFSELSFNILGNIPDVTSMDGGTIHNPSIEIRTLEEIYISLKNIIDNYFPPHNTSSYQPLTTEQGDISAIVLANVFVGLLICEEANRGDRWFCRNVMKEEDNTTQLGAAMPLAYFAAKSFAWGVQLNKKTARNLTR